MPNKSKLHNGFIPIVILIIVLIVVLGTGGYFLLARKGTNPPTASQGVVTNSPTPSAASTLTPIPTVDISTWKQYTNASMGISLKYPSTWIPTEDKNTVSLKAPDSSNCLPPNQCGGGPISPLVIKLLDNQQKKTLDEFVIEYIKNNDLLAQEGYISNLTPILTGNGLSAVDKVFPGACGEQIVFVSAKDKVLVFDMNCIDASDNEKKAIFSTLKLTK